jgi:hypothetical protein
MTLAKTVATLLAPKMTARLFEYSETQTEPETSSALLKVIGMPANCPHCGSEVPANHGHACTRRYIGRKWVWTRVNTPL